MITCMSVAGQSTDQFYKDLDGFYAKHVVNGKVDYKAISKDPKEFNTLIDKAHAIKVSQSNALDYQSFWINAYNLHVIKGIIDNYPIASPLDKKGFFDTITHSIAGQSITLNDIENNLLRKKFNDPRFHFVLVCGAVGCPPLISESYKPATLDSQLTTQTTLAVNDKNFTRIGKNTVELSQIFEWYKGDFEQKGKTIDFLNTYLKTPLTKNTKVKYYPYNWNINKQ